MPEWESLRAGDPAQIGRYRIVGRLADSGHGVVFLAEIDGGERRALKVLHTRLAKGSAGRDHVLNGVRAASRTPLFGMARIFDVDFDDDYPYVVSEYVPGKSLQFVVAREGPFGGAALHRLAVATLTALAAMHRAELVHRDVKPQNVVFGPDGPTIVDYGIAQALEDAGTEVRGAVGTPPYRAPEQLLGLPAGPAADMFAWGVTMTYAATGHPGFTDADPAGDRFRHGEPDTEGVPEPLRGVVTRCLAKDPAERPTAREAWDAVLSAEPTTADIKPAPTPTADKGGTAERGPVTDPAPAAGPPTASELLPVSAAPPPGRGGRWARGRRAYLIAAAAVIVVVGASAAVIIPRTTADHPGRTTHQPAAPAPPHLTVGSANFPENALLAEIYALALEARGFSVTRKFGLGIREVTFPMVKSGAISVMPEYNGALLTTSVDKNSAATSTDLINYELSSKLPPTLEILKSAPAENKDSVTVTKPTAERYDLHSIADLKDVAGDMVMGAPSEFETRQQGSIGLRLKYGVSFKAYQPLQTGDQSTAAKLLKLDQIQAADLFTTDPAIKENKFQVLDDPKNLFIAQNVTPLAYKPALNDTARDALNAVSKQLTTGDLLEMNRKVAEHETPERVARDWLRDVGILK